MWSKLLALLLVLALAGCAPIVQTGLQNDLERTRSEVRAVASGQAKVVQRIESWDKAALRLSTWVPYAAAGLGVALPLTYISGKALWLLGQRLRNGRRDQLPVGMGRRKCR